MSIKAVPFLDVFEDESGGNVKTPQSEYLSSGRFPVVDQGKALIAGYVDDETRLCGGGRPAIVFGDHTRCVKYAGFPFCMGADGVKVLRPKIEADLKYLYYFLNQLDIPNAGYDRHYKYLKRTEVVLQSLPEQRRIAAILDQADALRAKRRAALAQLDSLTQSIFIEMFGDPVLNPKKWKVIPFKEACETKLGKMLDARQQTGQDKRRYLRNANVQWFRVDLFDLLEMDFDSDARKKFSLQGGDLLICEGGEPGRAAIWHAELEDIYFQKALHRGRPKSDVANPEYLVWLLWFLANNGGLGDHISTATIAHLTGEKLKAMPIPVPPLELQQTFAVRLRSLDNLKKAHCAALQKMDTLFASLQYRAFNGEL